MMLQCELYLTGSVIIIVCVSVCVYGSLLPSVLLPHERHVTFSNLASTVPANHV